MTSHGAGKSALDEFLPESVLASEISRFRGEPRGEIELFVSADDVQLDPIEAIVPSRAHSSSVQMWPMLAAALVALGVSMLALAAFARFGSSLL